MQRHDLYTGVHKGLRGLLFTASTEVARTDFACADAARTTSFALRRVLAFLHEHVQHEDEAILPVLAALAPELFADLRSEHARVEGLEQEVAGLLERLERAGEAERVSLGQRLHARTGLLVAEHLRHMAREEGEVNRVLWAHKTDAELLEIEGRIVGSIPPARLAEWLEVLLPAMAPAERAELLGGLRSAVPGDAFDALVSPARSALGEPAFHAALGAAV